MRARLLLWIATIATGNGTFAAQPPGAQAVVVLVADQHSAYDRTAQLVAHVEALKTANPAIPMAICVDGDVFERGNAVALRSKGEIDLAMLATLARQACTVVNLGNHDPEFHDVAEIVRRLKAAGVTVVSNVMDRATLQPFASASARITLGQTEAVVVGLCTDRLATFPPAVRQGLQIPDPATWAKENVPKLLGQARVGIVLSHAGLRADREWLPAAPPGTLVAGAHDHLRFVHQERGITYVHSGSWNEYVTHAWLTEDAAGCPSWVVEQVPIAADATGPEELVRRIRATEAQHLTAADRTVVATTARAYTPPEAELLVVRGLREAAKVDAALVGHTTFGAGLPKGDVTAIAFDACVRFDGTIFVGEVTGTMLAELLARANQGPDTPWTERRGEYLVAAGPDAVIPARRYTIAVTDWIARNPAPYLGRSVVLREQPGLRLKAIAIEALKRAR